MPEDPGFRQVVEHRIEDRDGQQRQQQAERLAADHQHADRAVGAPNRRRVEITSGIMPATSAIVVIRIGRRRSRFAWMIAS